MAPNESERLVGKSLDEAIVAVLSPNGLSPNGYGAYSSYLTDLTYFTGLTYATYVTNVTYLSELT